MRKTRRIIPFVFCGLLISCTTERRLARVRISQPQMKETVADTGKQLPGQIAWTDDKGEEHLVKQVSHDSVTGENMTLIELTPVAYKPSDTLYLDKIFLSGADFAKMQEKGYMRYRAFMNSIIPDSLYMQKLLDSKGYKKALAELEEEYFQAWKHEVIAKERWVDWSDKTNARFALFNYKMERNRQAIAGYNSILEYLPAYWMRREIDGKYIPSKWKMFAEGNYKIRTRSITPEDSAAITERFTDYKKIAENQKRKEQAGAMYEKYVRFPYEPARLDTVIKQGNSFVYYYKQELPATENTKKIELTLDGQILSRDEVRTQLPPSDTITYYISSMVQFLDRTPRYRKKIITRKDEVSLRAYVTYKSGSTGFDEKTGNNKAEIDKVFETIRGINYTGEFLIDSIRMTATSSPEGSSEMNLFLSRERALELKKYLAARTEDREGVDTLFRPRWTGEDWDRLHELVLSDDSLANKAGILRILKETKNPDSREHALREYASDYKRIRERYYPLLRCVEFNFHLHRRDMIQDTIVMPVIDSTYMHAVSLIENRQYKQALSMLEEFYGEDYNTAVCLMSLGYDSRALDVMLKQPDTSDRNYLLSILYSRLGREKEALKMYVRSCDQDDSKIWRGKLDPEINKLIVTYNLYKDELY